MDRTAEREKLAIESLLENESLTAGLNAKVAQSVLEWGIEMTQTIMRGTSDLDEQAAEQSTYAQMKALRRLLRDMSRLLTALPYMNVDDLLPQLDTLIGYTETILGQNFRPPLPEDRSALALQLTSLREEPLRAAARLRYALAGASSVPKVESDQNAAVDEPEVDNDF